MKKFLNIVVPGYVPPHRKTVAKKIQKRFLDHFQNLKKTLKKAQHIALTTDVWKNKHLSYFIVLTAHFFDDNFKYHSLKIAFKKLDGRHLSSNLASVITNELVVVCEKLGEVDLLHKLTQIDRLILKYIMMNQSLYV